MVTVDRPEYNPRSCRADRGAVFVVVGKVSAPGERHILE
jgi:hypothetical protein